ncbi:MAG: RNA-binding protein [Chitinispirillia bacterium]|jgi:RNA recognition motif-containing protein
MNIYVGNLSYEMTEDELRQTFEQHGEVGSVKIIQDRYTGRSKGFGFIEMLQNQQALDAIQNLNGRTLKGKNVIVNEARPRESRPRRSNSQQGGRRW